MLYAFMMLLKEEQCYMNENEKVGYNLVIRGVEIIIGVFEKKSEFQRELVLFLSGCIEKACRHKPVRTRSRHVCLSIAPRSCQSKRSKAIAKPPSCVCVPHNADIVAVAIEAKHAGEDVSDMRYSEFVHHGVERALYK